MKPNC